MTNMHFPVSFKLSSGGLFYSILTRLHIQESGRYSTRRRIFVLTTLCWLPLFLLAAYEGNLISHQLDIPFVYDMKPYVRFLITIPFLIVVDELIDPLIAGNLQGIGSSGVIGEADENTYKKAVERFRSGKDSYLADMVILVVIAIMVILYLVNLEDFAADYDRGHWAITRENNASQLTYAGWWFVLVSSPLLQILLFRWFWRFYLWAGFLFRVSRINLNLQPTHPDMAGGLGILKNGESSFILIFVAFGAMLSVSLADQMRYGDMTFTLAQYYIAGYIGASILIMTLPLVFFTGQLIQAKRRGRLVYGDLGYRLSEAFDRKWGDPEDKSSGEELLKTADASAVCDYSDVYDVVREMQYLPIRMKDFAAQAFLLVMPFIPLIFIKIPVTVVIKRIFESLI